MKVFRSAFRRHSSHSVPATGCKKKAVLVGIKYDTSGSPKCEAFGVLGGPHEDVYAVRSLLIGPVTGTVTLGDASMLTTLLFRCLWLS